MTRPLQGVDLPQKERSEDKILPPERVGTGLDRPVRKNPTPRKGRYRPGQACRDLPPEREVNCIEKRVFPLENFVSNFREEKTTEEK